MSRIELLLSAVALLGGLVACACPTHSPCRPTPQRLHRGEQLSRSDEHIHSVYDSLHQGDKRHQALLEFLRVVHSSTGDAEAAVLRPEDLERQVVCSFLMCGNSAYRELRTTASVAVGAVVLQVISDHMVMACGVPLSVDQYRRVLRASSENSLWPRQLKHVEMRDSVAIEHTADMLLSTVRPKAGKEKLGSALLWLSNHRTGLRADQAGRASDRAAEMLRSGASGYVAESAIRIVGWSLRQRQRAGALEVLFGAITSDQPGLRVAAIDTLAEETPDATKGPVLARAVDQARSAADRTRLLDRFLAVAGSKAESLAEVGREQIQARELHTRLAALAILVQAGESPKELETIVGEGLQQGGVNRYRALECLSNAHIATAAFDAALIEMIQSGSRGDVCLAFLAGVRMDRPAIIDRVSEVAARVSEGRTTADTTALRRALRLLLERGHVSSVESLPEAMRPLVAEPSVR